MNARSERKPIRQPRDRLILALDVQDRSSALELAGRVKEHVGFFKIGLELFIRCGPPIVRDVAALGGVLLDLKLHDIPATVRGAVAAAAPGKPDLLTVHASAGPEAMREAVQAAGSTGIIAVTVLTSLSQEDLDEMGMQVKLGELAARRASSAKAAGCAGVVCSVHEAEGIRRTCGSDFLIITPGIRPSWASDRQDQKRVDTPAGAMRKGADMIVVGRAVTGSPDPADAAARILEEIEG